MAYVITKKNGKPYKLPGKPTARDIPVWTRDDVDGFSRDGKANGDCWTLTNVVTRRSINVGACKRETPADLWGGSFLEKLFGKKKPKRHPMSKRIMFVPGRGASPMSHRGELVTIGRARRKRRRRR